MRERVSVILGENPILLVVPHGCDDINTVTLAKEAAIHTKAFAVINQGFQRSEAVDVDADLADCNRVDHAKEPVVYDEFLKPIIKIVNQYTIKPFHIFHIHGAGNIVHKEAAIKVGVIVGYGLGKEKDSLTCQLWQRNLFVKMWRMHGSNEVFDGIGGGKFAGRSSNNLNQYFRKHYIARNVCSMQLEFPYSARDTETNSKHTAHELSDTLLSFLEHDHFDGVPNSFFL